MMSKLRIPQSFKNNYKFIENFSYLSLLQIFNLLVPLITYPYLIRVVGPEMYGTVVFAQSIIGYFSLVIEFGFNISGTKSISENVHDTRKISEVVSSILLLKLMLWIICLGVLALCMWMLPVMREHKILYLFAFTFTFNEFLFPQFFFQGIEKLKYVTFINVFTRSIFLVLVFFVIKDQSDYFKIPLLNGLGAFIGGMIALYIVFVKEKIRFVLPSIQIMKTYFIESFTIFSTKLSYNLRDKTVIVLVGILFTKTVVAYYDLAMKLVGLFTSLYQTVPVAVLPRLIKNRNHSFSKLVFIATIFVGVLYSLLIFIFSKQIVLFLGGEELAPAIPYVILLTISATFFAVNTLLNYYLIINSDKNIMLKTTFYSLFLFIALLPILFLKCNLYVLVIIFISSIVFETFYKLYIFNNNQSLRKWIL
ncbi:oligosaccharide flippase family protein [Dysgonomonas sp. HDW5A]|uniref:oligosaccharide flippase family protein n=1 Tax=Dysgonomonas sp. HDW5A TaxID=2714926 RepID=UPI001409B6F9|nr:oligosaccharide flippase family protein [Dysgonomonas sp. HDW5A]QIK61570.1 oligosaccharide flippase family protein [Dysgonomonas sp. HDW5A]